VSRSPNVKQRVLVCAGAHRGEQGLAMMALLAMVMVLTTLAALVLYLTGKETALAAVRLTGAQSLYAAEGGAFAGRSALMAYLNAYPQGSSSVDPSLGDTQATTWYSGGTNSTQNPFALFDYLITDKQRFTLGASSATPSETFQVNWGSGWPHLKLQVGGAPVNTMGGGEYTASVQLFPNPQPHSSCNPAGSNCAIHKLGPSSYEIFYKYTVTSDGQVPPKFRRRVVLNGNFSVQLRLQSFSMYALFTDVHNSPTGGPVWFSSTTNFTGPVHTNGEFRFAQFPTFTDKMESVSGKAWFYNNGSNLELSSPENVVGGTRVDAPLVPPDPDPQAATPANFTLGASTVPMPANSFNQQGVAVGRNPTDSSAVTTAQITSAIPELKNAGSVPNGVYVPVADKNGVCRSDSGASMMGGIYVQGTVDSLTMSVSGSTAVYTLTQGAIQTTVTVDRANNNTTVTSNGWPPPPSGGSCPSGTPPGPPSRTFVGVPKGWQGPGNDNAAVVYVNGNINALSGTLQQNEQTSIVSAGSIGIAGNVLYQTPPNPADPTSNPINVLGLYAAGGDIQIMPTAPNNLIIDAILMAGSSGSAYNSSVNVQNWNTGSPRGNVNLLGGLIEKYYGNFGTYNTTLKQQATGYGRAFSFDTRMSRGFTPPFFPTTNLFMVVGGSQRLAGVRPVWREATPP
jgi:hypothetical protein